MQNALKALMVLAAGLAAFVFAAPQASAASAGSATLTLDRLLAGSAVGSFTETVQYGPGYRRAHRRCRRRFGHGPGYRRCMRRMGYHRGRPGYRNRCRRVHIQCRRRWGYGWRFRRCVRARGC